MEIAWGDVVRVYGPLALGWVVAAYLLKFVLDRYQADIDARSKLASALESLTKVIEGKM
jgi:hypothetical protein